MDAGVKIIQQHVVPFVDYFAKQQSAHDIK